MAVVIVACGDGGRPPPGGTSSGLPAPDSGPGEGGIDSGGDADLSKCKNTLKDGEETDVDCGGVCGGCALGKTCKEDNDCADKAAGAKCTNNVCALCSDGKTNGDETDVDCGGKACGPCGVGKQCKVGLDCKSEACTANACACPANMTIVARATGGAYCVDSTEVTKGQYNKFITANVPVTTQIAACLGTNTTFIPRGAWPPATTPSILEFTLSLPVHYVDWCDAYAYCKWAKKEMCGTVNGGPIAMADTNDSTKDAWYNACTAQGTKDYPYGGSFDTLKCNGKGANGASQGLLPTNAGFGHPENEDDDVYQIVTSDVNGNILTYTKTGCQGGSVSLYQMSGNVAEWEDSCDGAGNCKLRGGSYTPPDLQSNLRCDANRVLQRVPPLNAQGAADLKDVGIRCCLY